MSKAGPRGRATKAARQRRLDAARARRPSVRVLRDRGTWLASPLASSLTVTVHPSSLLRAATPEARAEARAAFVADLREVARRLGKEATKAGTSLALSRAGDR